MRTPTETLSIESRFTADRSGTGSSPGSSTTSLASPRIVVVQGATSTRRSLGIAASLESTTTGRRPMLGGSHHQTSDRAGSPLKRSRRLLGTRPSRPTHLPRPRGDRRTAHRWHRVRRPGAERSRLRALRREERSLGPSDVAGERSPACLRRPLCSPSFYSCHYHAISMLRVNDHSDKWREGPFS
jgi:hypothetical protein